MKIDWEKHLKPAGMSLEQFVFGLYLIDYKTDEIAKLVGKSPEWVFEAAKSYEKIARAEISENNIHST